MDILAKLGIDWKLLIAQVINFVVLLWVLRRYAYQPILRALEARTKKIEQGLSDAAQSQAKLQDIVEEEKRVMAIAREEARDILLKAEANAQERDASMLRETKKKIDTMIADADVHLSEERARLVREAKTEILELVVLATERVLGESVDAKVDAALIKKALKMSE
jgi:F-type H+-transporting ATPase subunit b